MFLAKIHATRLLSIITTIASALSRTDQTTPKADQASLRPWESRWRDPWKAIIDTNGHYARPDLVGLSVTNHKPSQHPVVFRTQPKPALLAEAAERNGVEPALVESVMHEAARLDAPVNR
jgi:hypothetical protein